MNSHAREILKQLRSALAHARLSPQERVDVLSALLIEAKGDRDQSLNEQAQEEAE